MGSKNKLKRFRENETFPNVIQPERDDVLKGKFPYKGSWRKDFFKNKNPIVLELGCGKGEYTVHLAQRSPHINHIGIDIKGARFWRGAKTAIEEGYTNVCFIRMQVELIVQCFAEGEVNEIWITFPDPQIKYKRTKHRMTNPDFLNKYKKILKPNGIVHLKTDSEYMHGYTLGLLQGLGLTIEYAHHDVYGTTNAPKEVTDIQTYYESQYLAINKKITYLRFNFS